MTLFALVMWPHLCALCGFMLEAKMRVTWYMDAALQDSGCVKYINCRVKRVCVKGKEGGSVWECAMK